MNRITFGPSEGCSASALPKQTKSTIAADSRLKFPPTRLRSRASCRQARLVVPSCTRPQCEFCGFHHKRPSFHPTSTGGTLQKTPSSQHDQRSHRSVVDQDPLFSARAGFFVFHVAEQPRNSSPKRPTLVVLPTRSSATRTEAASLPVEREASRVPDHPRRS